VSQLQKTVETKTAALAAAEARATAAEDSNAQLAEALQSLQKTVEEHVCAPPALLFHAARHSTIAHCGRRLAAVCACH
jgi:hypothetical protein